MRPVSILEFPSNLGLIEPAKGYEPGVKKLPDWLRLHQFHQRIHPVEVVRLNPPVYTMQIDAESRVRNAQAIAAYAKEQAAIIEKTISENKFPLVIGGDCSILIGNALGLNRMGEYGLFFLDGHTDFMWPELSQTAGAAGMDLAIVTGHGHQKLTNIENRSPYFAEENVWCVGNREYDPQYVQAILDSGIAYFDLATLRETGMLNCVNLFLEMLEKRKLAGFWIHIDVDVLNDEVMPAVDSRGAGGLYYAEFEEILGRLLGSKKVTGLEITILDPELDPEGIYTKPFVNSFCDVLFTNLTNFHNP